MENVKSNLAETLVKVTMGALMPLAILFAVATDRLDSADQNMVILALGGTLAGATVRSFIASKGLK